MRKESRIKTASAYFARRGEKPVPGRRSAPYKGFGQSSGPKSYSACLILAHRLHRRRSTPMRSRLLMPLCDLTHSQPQRIDNRRRPAAPKTREIVTAFGIFRRIPQADDHTIVGQMRANPLTKSSSLRKSKRGHRADKNNRAGFISERAEDLIRDRCGKIERLVERTLHNLDEHM